MKTLTPDILESYEVPIHRPSGIRGVQFGDDPLLLGLVDRLLDDANAAGADIGLAVLSAPGGHAAALKSQGGLYTTFVRGEEGEKQIHREQVVQCILQALEPENDDAEFLALARSDEICFLLLHPDPIREFPERDQLYLALAARFLSERWKAQLPPPAILVCGESANAGEQLRESVRKLAKNRIDDTAFDAWLNECHFISSIADCLTARSSAEEAVRLCGEMNYKDAMIHLAEPYGLWAIDADPVFRSEFPLENCPQIRYTHDLQREFLLKHRLFDAGLFSFVAAGLLRGNETLADCMKDTPLRELAGHALTDELLPRMSLPREVLIPYVILCYERYQNPMNDNRLETVGRGLIHRFNQGILPVFQACARESLPPPEKLTVALAATVMLLADTRPKESGFVTVCGDRLIPVHESPEVLEALCTLSSDMDPESLAYAVLSDRTLWNGEDLRDLPGLQEALSANLAG